MERPPGVLSVWRFLTSLSLHKAKLKKEMARRTGLSYPTVKKYLKMIDFSFTVW